MYHISLTESITYAEDDIELFGCMRPLLISTMLDQCLSHVNLWEEEMCQIVTI